MSSVLMDSIRKHPNCEFFKIQNSEGSLFDWTIIPTALKLIPNNDGHYLVKADIRKEHPEYKQGVLDL